MPNSLIVSLVLSLVATVVLNLGLRAFPRAGDRAARRMQERLDQRTKEPNRSKVQVFFPWKAMLLGSVSLTILVNLAKWLS